MANELDIKRTKNDVEAIFSLLDEVNSRLVSTLLQLHGLDRTLHSVKGQISLADKRTEKLDDRFDCVEGRMDTLEGRIDRVDDRMDGMDRKLDRLIEALIPGDEPPMPN
jgi:chromosome segregation ATPase